MSQTVAALLELRELILEGALKPGVRLSEVALVERLKVSRTPVRAALQRLEAEGLVEPLPFGGFAVRAFSQREVIEAIELRGALEGLAARFAAEKHTKPDELVALSATLEAIDRLMGAASFDFSQYVDLNESFHDGLAALAASPPLAHQLARAVALPFASPSAFVLAQAHGPDARRVVTVAQHQHWSVVDAIRQKDGTRAEALMREHAHLARRNLRMALLDGQTFRHVRGAALIERDVA